MDEFIEFANYIEAAKKRGEKLEVDEVY